MQPVFSPDNSVSQIRALIDSATQTLQIQNQYLYKASTTQPWILTNGQVNSPIMEGVLNAVNRGVAVQILLNGVPPAGGATVDTYNAGGFLAAFAQQVTGAGSLTVKYAGGNIYFHNKGIIVDGVTVLISSINFSDTALNSNREAGIILYNNAQIAAYYAGVFATDFNAGVSPTVDTSYTSFTYSPTSAPVDKISHPPIQGTVASLTLFSNPDNANAFVINQLKSFTTSLHAEMYEITTTSITNAFKTALTNNPNADCTILQSTTVIGDQSSVNGMDNLLASQPSSTTHCSVFNSQFNIQHAKFWIIDGHITTIFSGNWALTSLSPSGYANQNREWGVAIDSLCVAGVYEQLLSADRNIGSVYSSSYSVCTNYDACGICNGNGRSCSGNLWADGITSCSSNSGGSTTVTTTSSSSAVTTNSPVTTTKATTTTRKPVTTTANTGTTQSSATTTQVPGPTTTVAPVTPAFADVKYKKNKQTSSSWSPSAYLSQLAQAIALTDPSVLSIYKYYTTYVFGTPYYHIVIEVVPSSNNPQTPLQIAQAIVSYLQPTLSGTGVVSGLASDPDLGGASASVTDPSLDPQNQTNSDSGSNGLDLWVYIVIAVGGIVLLTVAIVGIVLCKRKKDRETISHYQGALNMATV